MDRAFILAQELHSRNLSAADLQRKKNISRESLFLISVAHYLLTLSNPNTKEHYRTVIDQFTNFIKNVRNTTPLDAIGIDILLWKDDLERTGGVVGTKYGTNLDKYFPHEKASVQNKIAIISAFYKFLQKPGMDGSAPLIAYNPVDALHDKVKVDKYSRSKKITLESLQKILEQIDNSWKGLRDYALIYGYFITGRRNSEWISLKWGQINRNSNPPTYSFTRKGQLSTVDELPESLWAAITNYLKARWGDDFAAKIEPNTYIFTAMPGRGGTRQIVNDNHPLDERSMLYIIKGYAKKAGLDPTKITVHSLRHLHAESYLEAGASVEEVRARLCHASLATTQRYVSSMSNDKNRLASKLDDMINKKHN